MSDKKIWYILTDKSRSYERGRVLAEAKKMDLPLLPMKPESISALLSETGPQFFYNSELLEIPRAVWIKIGPLFSTAQEVVIARQMESAGYFTINTLLSRQRADQKFWTYQELSRKNLPIPKTIALAAPLNEKVIEEHFTYPFVLKPDRGSKGLGVMLIENRKQLRSVSGLLEYVHFDEPILIQEFLDFENGSDIRVLVVGDQVLGAMLRTPAADSFTANFSTGGLVQHFNVDESMSKIALQAAKALDLKVAGIDLLRQQSGYVICEVNANPGFQGFETATGLNVPKAVFEYLLKETS